MIVYEDLHKVELDSTQPEIYDRPIGVRLLHQDPNQGAMHYLVRYPEGLIAQRHRHTAAHTIVLVDGSLAVNGRTIGPGTYCHFAAGEPMHHAPAEEGSCLFVIIFDAPFDVEPLADR